MQDGVDEKKDQKETSENIYHQELHQEGQERSLRWNLKKNNLK